MIQLLKFPEEGERFRKEIEAYVRELPRLVREGHEHHFVVLRDGEVFGPWATRAEGFQFARERFQPGTFFVQEIYGVLLEPLRVKLGWAAPSPHLVGAAQWGL